MIKSSEKFSLQNKEEKEIFFNFSENHKDVTCVLTIKYRKCNFCCASYCLCGLIKFHKVKFFIENKNEFFVAKFINLESGEVFSYWIFSNLDIKIIQIPKGRYNIFIFQNMKALLKMNVDLTQTQDIFKLEIEI